MVKRKGLGKPNDLGLSSAGEPAGTSNSWGALRGRHKALTFQNYNRLAAQRSVHTAGRVEGAIQLPMDACFEVTLSEVLTHMD